MKGEDTVLEMTDDIEMITCGAFIAGCMEKAGMIYTDTDEELACYLVDIYNEYCRSYGLDESFAEYAERRLLEHFNVTQEEKS